MIPFLFFALAILFIIAALNALPHWKYDYAAPIAAGVFVGAGLAIAIGVALLGIAP